MTWLKWPYEPVDFFEFKQSHSLDVGLLEVGDGVARLTLADCSGEPDAVFRSSAEEHVRCVFDAHAVTVHKGCSLGPMHLITTGSDSKERISVFVDCATIAVIAPQVDFVVTSGDGNTVRDTKAERAERQQEFLDSIARDVGRSPVLGKMLRSYRQAVDDKDDELVHLYEVRDRLKTHFGNEAAARNALGVTKKEWQRLGELANAAPVSQGRHRGEQSATRPATPAELDEARTIARLLIERFLETLPAPQACEGDDD